MKDCRAKFFSIKSRTVDKNSIINGVGKNKVNRAKIDAKTAKSKSKNVVKPSLAKSQSFV